MRLFLYSVLALGIMYSYSLAGSIHRKSTNAAVDDVVDERADPGIQTVSEPIPCDNSFMGCSAESNQPAVLVLGSGGTNYDVDIPALLLGVGIAHCFIIFCTWIGEHHTGLTCMVDVCRLHRYRVNA
jgi:hypothetical protein